VGRGGKTLWGEQRFEGLVKGRLVGLDRQEVIPPTLKEDLLRGLLIGVERVGQDDLARQLLLAQKHARGAGLIGFGGGYHTAQKAALRIHGIDDLHPGMTHLLAVHNHDRVLRGT
jgi:hypothetical protein